MFEVDLTSQIPQYGAQSGNWGGAACCQMAMKGYPAGAASCFIDQTVIWNHIQANNKEPGASPAWGIGWYADPYAVTKTLNDLCPPQHHWVDVSGTDKNAVLYTLLRYMANYRYGSPVCVWAHDYWSLLVYYRTSDDPRSVSNPTIESVGLYSPYQGGCDYKEIDGAVWMNSPYWWGAPCNGSLCGKLWDGKWVGIGEPPQAEGRVRVEAIARTGDALISPQQAQKAARAVFAARGAERLGATRRSAGMVAGRPFLVREPAALIEKSRKPRREVHYYVVPFYGRHDVDAHGIARVRASVLVNAFTGRFEEIALFDEPVRYVPAREALRIAGDSLVLSEREQAQASVELVAQPAHTGISSAVPAWSIAAAERTVLVTQDGIVVGGPAYPSYRGA